MIMRIDGRRLLWALPLLVCFFLASTPAHAEMVIYPARLEIKEVEPGLFEVSFRTSGNTGKSTECSAGIAFCMYPVCQISQISGDANMKITRWRVSCLPDSLYGEGIWY